MVGKYIINTVFVFYNSRQWHRIIGVIADFITDQKVQGKVFEWFLFLNKDKGDCIELTLFTLSQAEFESLLIIPFLRRYIKCFPSEDLNYIYPLDTFFSNYPNNCILFNIKSYNFISDDEISIIGIRQNLSISISKALTKSEIDEEEVLTFLLYLKIGAIKSRFNAFDKACLNISVLTDFVTKMEPSQDHSKIVSYNESKINFILLNNSNNLKEIISDVFSSPLSESDWLHEWIATCAKWKPELTFFNYYFYLSNIIYQHVGFGDALLTKIYLDNINMQFNIIP